MEGGPAGNRKLMEHEGIDIGELAYEAERLSEQGKTPMFISVDGSAAGIIAVADTLRDESVQAVQQLHDSALRS